MSGPPIAEAMRPAPLALLVLLALPAALPLAHGQSDAPAIPVTTLAGRLSAPLELVAAAYVEPYLYILGGEDCTAGRTRCVRSDAIYAYHVEEDAMYRAPVALPEGISDAAAAAVDGKVYLFGGTTASDTLDSILVYDPALETVEILDARLPEPRRGLAAATDGRVIHLFGGFGAFGRGYDDILQFDPARGTLTALTAQLDDRLGWRSAVWTGDAFYALGGYSSGAFVASGIERFDPASGDVEFLPVRLPSPNYGAAAVSVHGLVFLLGGGGLSSGDQLVGWDPNDGEVGTVLASLPEPRVHPEAIAIGERIYVVGEATTLLAIDLPFADADDADAMDATPDPAVSEPSVFSASCDDPAGDVVGDSGARGSYPAADIRSIRSRLENGEVKVTVAFDGAPWSLGERHALEVDIEGTSAADVMMLDDATGSIRGQPEIWGSYPDDSGTTLTYTLASPRTDASDLVGERWSLRFTSLVLSDETYRDEVRCAADDAPAPTPPTPTPTRAAPTRTTPTHAPTQPTTAAPTAATTADAPTDGGNGTPALGVAEIALALVGVAMGARALRGAGRR